MFKLDAVERRAAGAGMAAGFTFPNLTHAVIETVKRAAATTRFTSFKFWGGGGGIQTHWADCVLNVLFSGVSGAAGVKVMLHGVLGLSSTAIMRFFKQTGAAGNQLVGSPGSLNYKKKEII